MRRNAVIAFFTGMLVAACGDALSSIHEYIISVQTDVKGSFLAPQAKDDRPLSVAATEKFYAYPDEDVRNIKKYIVSLEEKLKDCQKAGTHAATP